MVRQDEIFFLFFFPSPPFFIFPLHRPSPNSCFPFLVPFCVPFLFFPLPFLFFFSPPTAPLPGLSLFENFFNPVLPEVFLSPVFAGPFVLSRLFPPICSPFFFFHPHPVAIVRVPSHFFPFALIFHFTVAYSVYALFLSFFFFFS